MDGTEPPHRMEKGEASRPPPFLRLYRALALDSQFLYSEVAIVYGVGRFTLRSVLGLVLYSPYLGTLLCLAAYFLDRSVNLDHKSIFSRVSHFFRPGIAHQWGSSAVCRGPLPREGSIRGTVAIHLLGAIQFWFGYITDTSTSDSMNTEVIRSA